MISKEIEQQRVEDDCLPKIFWPSVHNEILVDADNELSKLDALVDC